MKSSDETSSLRTAPRPPFRFLPWLTQLLNDASQIADSGHDSRNRQILDASKLETLRNDITRLVDQQGHICDLVY